MKSDTHVLTKAVLVSISQIGVSSAPVAHGALTHALEQLLVSDFESDAEQNAAFMALRDKADEFSKNFSSEEKFALANSFADTINKVDSSNKMESLPHVTVGGCEFLTNHFIVMMTRDAPDLDLSNLERAHRVLNARLWRPRITDSRSPTDKLGPVRGFSQGVRPQFAS